MIDAAEDMDKLSTWIIEVTVMFVLSTFAPSIVETEMIACPSETPVTLPFVSTVATAGLLLVHSKRWSVASEGAIVAVSNVEPPIAILVAGGIVTPLTDTYSVILTSSRYIDPTVLLTPVWENLI
ncbi:hypothetical protein D3C73_902370 [compost metagenome]